MPCTTIQLPTLRRDVSSSEGEIAVDFTNRTIKGSFSSERPVERFDWFEWIEFDEITSGKEEHWDLERVNSGVCPFLPNHYSSSQIGLVTRVWFKDNFGHFEAKISRSAEGDQALKDAQDKIFGGLSYGYRVLEYEEISPAEYEGEGKNKAKVKNQVLLATKIVLYEISRASVPADPTVSLQRGQSDTPMEARIVFKSQKQTRGQETKSGSLDLSSREDNKNVDEEKLRTQLTEAQDQLIQVRSQYNESQDQIRSLTTQLEQRDAQITQLTENLGQLTRRQEVSDRYNQIRRKAEELVSETKITAAEFDDIFGKSIDDDVERLLKSASETANSELSSLEFYVGKASKRSAMLNTKSAVGDEPIQQPQEPVSSAAKSYGENLDLKSVEDDRRIRAKANELGLDPNNADHYVQAMVEAGITY